MTDSRLRIVMRSLGEHEIFLSLGSNLGDKRLYLREAIHELEISGVNVLQASSIYVTEPVDFTQQDWFLNQVLGASTTLLPEELLLRCLAAEQKLGRERQIPKGPRKIDIDILLYDEFVITSETLQIPHPRMHLRRFVLEPLVLLAPDLVHPVLKESFATLLAKCTDASRVMAAE